MKVYVKTRYKNSTSDATIKKILAELSLGKDYEPIYLEENGRNIVVENDGKRIYVIVSGDSAKGRNSFLAQYIPTVLRQYIEDECPDKEIYIYLLDTSSRAKTSYILDTYRVAKTLGIGILNESELQIDPINPYYSFLDWKNAKKDRQNYNTANKSSYAIEEEKEIVIYGKLFGANGKEATFTACQLAEIAKKLGKEVRFVQVREHGTELVSATDKKLLQHYGVIIEAGAIDLESRKLGKASTCRKQDEFRYNLLEKYGKKKCCLCECDIESSVVASHIHRITDIDKSPLSPDEKRRQAVDADNGLWLCANHDKMFEYGVISFNNRGEVICSKFLQPHQQKFVNRITTTKILNGKYLTTNLLSYLDLHNKRVHLDGK